MDNKELRKSLQQIREEIKNTHADDEQGQELLQKLDGDISALLEHPDEHLVHVHPTLIDRLESTFHHFEITRPQLTLLIADLLDTMSNAGI